jgi:hypothetical protein
MAKLIEIEDIEGLRRTEGIDDADLRTAIRGLRVGGFVKLTFLGGPNTSETLQVRITSIRGSAFRGKLANATASVSLRHLRVGTSVTFTAAHIHSIANKKSIGH